MKKYEKVGKSMKKYEKVGKASKFPGSWEKKLWNLKPSYPVVITTCVRYLGPPGRSTSQILGTFSRFSETFLADREGGS